MASPARASAVALGLTLGLAALLATVAIVVRPRHEHRNDFPGRKAQFEVEVSFPQATIAALNKFDPIEYQLRSGAGTEVASGIRDRVRHEDGRAIVPGVFRMREAPRTKLFAVMKNDSQLMCATLNVDGPADVSSDRPPRQRVLSTTEWSEWQEMEEGLLARWRLVVTPK